MRITLLKLKEMIFGRKSEKSKKKKEESEEAEKEAAQGGGQESKPSESTPSPRDEKQESGATSLAVKKRGHGRNPVLAYPGAKKVRCRRRQMKAGRSCLSLTCRGQVYPVTRPHRFTQFTWQPAITITIYEQDVMRCSDCGKEYEAPLPDGVSPKRYDETASFTLDAAIAINKCGLGTPYDRSATLQRDCGMPVSESVMSERCEAVADALFPIYQEMRRQAANGRVFHGDDTPVRILELMKENEKKERGERVGMQTSGIVVKTNEGAWIALYMNGRKHAGENLEELYKLRSEGLELPIRMGDALAANWSGDKERIEAKCFAHARRKFWEIRSLYRIECGYVLDWMVSVLKRSSEVRRNPAAFLPWMYQGEAAEEERARAA